MEAPDAGTRRAQPAAGRFPSGSAANPARRPTAPSRTPKPEHTATPSSTCVARTRRAARDLKTVRQNPTAPYAPRQSSPDRCRMRRASGNRTALAERTGPGDVHGLPRGPRDAAVDARLPRRAQRHGRRPQLRPPAAGGPHRDASSTRPDCAGALTLVMDRVEAGHALTSPARRHDRDEAGHREDGGHPTTCRHRLRARRGDEEGTLRTARRRAPPAGGRAARSRRRPGSHRARPRAGCLREGAESYVKVDHVLHRDAAPTRWSTPKARSRPRIRRARFRTSRAPRSSPSRTHRAVPRGADCRSGTEVEHLALAEKLAPLNAAERERE